MESTEDLLAELRESVGGVVADFERELNEIRSGRASARMFDHL